MREYLRILRNTVDRGYFKADRTGTGSYEIPGWQMQFDMADGFPAVTTKKLLWEKAFIEMLWFIRGETNTSWLKKHGVNIWDAWADKGGDLGPVYGYQWRKWENFVPVEYDTSTTMTTGFERHIDQIAILMHMLRNNPDSRRMIVTAWNPADLDKMALPPCHMFFQVLTEVIGQTDDGQDKRKLHLHVYIRSNDLFLGAPFNIAQYALLLHMLAHQSDMEPGILTYSIGSAHIYANHMDQVLVQLERDPYDLPVLIFNRKPESIFDYLPGDMRLKNYKHHPFIKGEVSV